MEAVRFKRTFCQWKQALRAEMIYTVHQPHYLPYPGYLAKVFSADQFVFLEDVQFVRREYQNRNRVKGPNGTVWLTVPVRGEYRSSILKTLVDESTDWRRKHLGTLQRFYARAQFLGELQPFAELLQEPYSSLAELTVATTSFFLDRFGINTPRCVQGSFDSLPETPNERIVEIGKRLGADTYLSGAGGRSYLDESVFRRAEIRVIYQDYHPSTYPQLHGGFLPNLGSVDLLLCAGTGGFDKYIRPVTEQE